MLYYEGHVQCIAVDYAWIINMSIVSSVTSQGIVSLKKKLQLWNALDLKENYALSGICPLKNTETGF